MRRYILLCLVLLLAFGCRNDQGKGQNQVIPSVNVSPISEAKPSQSPLTETIAYTPHSPVSTPTPMPQLTASTGAIRGQLTWYFEEELQVGNEIPLQIGEVLYDTEGIPRFHSIDTENDPVVWTDQSGHFVFLDVEPATYGLYLVIPSFDSFLLTEHEEPLALMIDVKANEITDLGDIILDFPF